MQVYFERQAKLVFLFLPHILIERQKKRVMQCDDAHLIDMSTHLAQHYCPFIYSRLTHFTVLSLSHNTEKLSE